MSFVSLLLSKADRGLVLAVPLAMSKQHHDQGAGALYSAKCSRKVFKLDGKSGRNDIGYDSCRGNLLKVA
jgi:hypothetical protein